ncbi:MAG: hypothetical protein ACOCUD_00890 [Bacillota bacterium]
MLNHIIANYNKPLIITSIGLDGEEIDQVTYLEKPQVYLRKNDLIATAKETLNKLEARYEILAETKIFTPIGNIIICRILSKGKALIAGPSLVSDMKFLINKIKELSTNKIIIDGAFFRKSFASISDASILVIGANYSYDIDKTVNNAFLTYKKLTLSKALNKYEGLKNKKNIVIIYQDKILELDFSSIIGKADLILDKYAKTAQAIFLPNTLTEELVEELTKKPFLYKFDIIVKSATNILLNDKHLKNIFRLNNKIYVLETIEIASVCFNPFSPRGYSYNKAEFASKLSKKLQREVIDVKEVDTYE